MAKHCLLANGGTTLAAACSAARRSIPLLCGCEYDKKDENGKYGDEKSDDFGLGKGGGAKSETDECKRKGTSVVIANTCDEHGTRDGVHAPSLGAPARSLCQRDGSDANSRTTSSAPLAMKLIVPSIVISTPQFLTALDLRCSGVRSGVASAIPSQRLAATRRRLAS